MKKENNPTDNTHDRGYKYLLSNRQVFLQLLRNFVREPWVEKLNAKDLVRLDKSYILQDFSGKEADIVYRLQTKDQEVIFYVLLELQSTVDFQMPYRLLLYMVEIWRDLLKNTPKSNAAGKEFRLPAVVPIVLYNGENNWTAKLHYRDTLKGAEMFGSHVLDFEYILVDVNRQEEEHLLELANLIGAVFLLDKKADYQLLMQRLKKLLHTLKDMTPDEFQLLKNWILSILQHKQTDHYGEIARLVEKARPEEAMEMIYNLEKTLDEEFAKRELKSKLEGKQEGKLEVARKLLRKGFALAEVAEITELTLDEIEKMVHHNH